MAGLEPARAYYGLTDFECSMYPPRNYNEDFMDRDKESISQAQLSSSQSGPSDQTCRSGKHCYLDTRSQFGW